LFVLKVNNEIKCKFCVETALNIKKQKENEKTDVEKSIHNKLNQIYNLDDVITVKNRNRKDKHSQK
jgi:hypothetical protein